MYTYEIDENLFISVISYNEAVVDIVGPWDSTDAAEAWASSYVNRKNLNI